MAPPTEIETLVGELELAVDRVRSLYEQYFMGIEKLEPTVPRKDVDRRIHILRKEQIRNTAQRFRFQMILQRYNTYQTHWQRICREIENGTYKRHVIRAQQRFGEGTAAQRRRDSARPPPPEVLTRDLAAELAEPEREFAPAGDAEEIDELDVELLEEPPRAPPPAPRQAGAPPPPPRPSQPGPLWRKAAGPPPPAPPSAPRLEARHPLSPLPLPPPTSTKIRAAAPPKPAPPAAKPAPPPVRPEPAAAKLEPAAPRLPAELPDARLRAIYAQYVDAKRKQNESTAAITYDAVAKSLRDSSAKLREKHGKPVDFEVAIKDGKAILKPVLK
ncbi:MAG TPA: MXAN_5187 C-terminal domain-containing protein [Polyangiaceae bacterium]